MPSHDKLTYCCASAIRRHAVAKRWASLPTARQLAKPVVAFFLILFAGVSPSVFARPGSDLARKATWSQPKLEEARARLEQYLASLSVEDAMKEKARAAFDAPPSSGDAEQLLDRTAAALAEVNLEFAAVRTAALENSIDAPQQFQKLFDETVPEFPRANLRLYYARWLAQHSHFDEALTHLEGLAPSQVIDPAALLFYRCIAQHRLLQKDECLRSLATLMENESVLPRRYTTLAQLMEADIKPLQQDSLDEVARLMEDIRRRLNFGHAGKRVRKQEDDVVSKLDKMIEQLEQQQQQQQQQASGGSQGGAQSSSPAQDSQALGGKGPGDVDQKSIGSKSGWGNLPPKEREEALQRISKDLPAHYREAIEEYFRKLAREGDSP